MKHSSTGLKGIFQLEKGVLVCIYSSYKTMNQAFLRFSTYQEDPKLMGKTFTWADAYLNLPPRSKKDISKYAGAHNVPPSVFKAFIDDRFFPLTKAESQIIKEVKRRKNSCYVIAFVGDYGMDYFIHEYAHALFGKNKSYRNAVTKLYKKHEAKLGEVTKFLIKHSYHQKVHIDETNAYMIDNEFLGNRKIDQTIIKEFKTLFNKYSKRIKAYI